MARLAVTALLTLASSALVVSAFAAPPLPSLPAPGAGGPAPQAPADVSGFTADQVRRGIVQIEQGGRPLEVGTVLLKDGRILTALSPIAGVDTPEIRYADGTVVKAKVGHKDAAWDLALLIPQTGKWLDGLVPTDSDPLGQDLRSFLPKGGKLSAAPVGVRGRLDAKSKQGDPLKSALDVDMKGSPGTLGAPLVDGNGRVMGVMVKACKEGEAPAAGAAPPTPNAPQPPCNAISIGAPVWALRGFLMKTPQTAVQPAPWLGLGGAPNQEGNTKGVKVMGVAPGSPAEKGGLKPNEDMIIAVDGSPVETPEQLAEAIGKRTVGQQVKLLVLSGGKFRDANVTLRSAP